jgi:trehalose/maltose transport system substrate-binding protein
MGDHDGKRNASQMERRDFLKLGSLALGSLAGSSLLSACGGGGGGGNGGGGGGGGGEITFASARFFGTSTMDKIVAAYNASQSKIKVNYQELPPPSSSTEVHQQLVQRLARRNGTPDVFTQDVIWIAEFAGAGWALPLDDYFDDAARKEYFPGLIAACTSGGKLTALPWFVDSGMLYYRKDLLDAAGLEVPKTWPELTDAAKKLTSDGKAKFGFLWQGKQAEVLVCDLVEFIHSNNGAILGADGKTVQIADPPAVQAVQFMRDTFTTNGISPKDVLSWDEEPSRRPFTAGQAAFLRNWSYVYNVSQDPKGSQVVDKVGVAPLPSFEGGKSAAALGGYQYGVNANSKNQDAAVEFLRWMSSPETQLRFALEMGLAPTRPAVFDEEQLKAKNAFMAKLKDVFVGATPRPVTPKYPQVTLAIQSGVSRALAGGDIAGGLAGVKQEIERAVAS